MQIDEKKVVEVIGRLIGRATSHKNSADQTPNSAKKLAHMLAHDDMISLANDLADATGKPEWAKSHAAYKWAVGLTPNYN